MKVVVVGSGAREHALAWKMRGQGHEVVVTPGNAGIIGSTSDTADIIDADLFVIGPEQPLVDGLADDLRAQGKLVCGPNADGAKLEGSKAWMKSIVSIAGIPTAQYRAGDMRDFVALEAFIQLLDGLVAVKTSYLAGGKGSKEHKDFATATADLYQKLEDGEVVVEEFLEGVPNIYGRTEVSLFAICDGTKAFCLGSACDYKKLLDGDNGPNTGGMGAFSPAPDVDEDEMMNIFITPLIHQLRKLGIDYRGIIYAGLMNTPDGYKLLEYNIRLGDPDGQVALMRLQSDLAVHLLEAAQSNLQTPVILSDEIAVTSVLASANYPNKPIVGDRIYGLDDSRSVEGLVVLQAGVRANNKNELVTAGGRVIGLMAQSKTMPEAVNIVTRGRNQFIWPGMQYRTDIGFPVRP